MYPRRVMPPRSVPLTRTSSSTSTRSSRLSRISGGSVSAGPPPATISIVIGNPVPGFPAESRPTGNNVKNPGALPAGIDRVKLSEVVSGCEPMAKKLVSPAVKAPLVKKPTSASKLPSARISTPRLNPGATCALSAGLVTVRAGPTVSWTWTNAVSTFPRASSTIARSVTSSAMSFPGVASRSRMINVSVTPTKSSTTFVSNRWTTVAVPSTALPRNATPSNVILPKPSELVACSCTRTLSPTRTAWIAPAGSGKTNVAN